MRVYSGPEWGIIISRIETIIAELAEGARMLGCFYYGSPAWRQAEAAQSGAPVGHPWWWGTLFLSRTTLFWWRTTVWAGAPGSKAGPRHFQGRSPHKKGGRAPQRVVRHQKRVARKWWIDIRHGKIVAEQRKSAFGKSASRSGDSPVAFRQCPLSTRHCRSPARHRKKEGRHRKLPIVHSARGLSITHKATLPETARAFLLQEGPPATALLCIPP